MALQTKMNKYDFIGALIVYLLTALIIMGFWNYVVFEVFFPVYFVRTMNFVQALITTTFGAMIYFYFKK